MTTQDKEAVEAEIGAAYAHAEEFFRLRRGIIPDEFTWKDAQYSLELNGYKASFLIGVRWQKQREKPLIGETHGDD